MGKLRMTDDFVCHTTIVIRLLDGAAIVLDGLQVKMPADLCEFDLVLHRPHKPVKKDSITRFCVSERLTGNIVGRGRSMKDAIQNAFFRMRQFSHDDIRQIIDGKRIPREERNAVKKVKEVDPEKLGSPTYESDTKIVSVRGQKKATK